jgi:hypothetical protein
MSCTSYSMTSMPGSSLRFLTSSNRCTLRFYEIPALLSLTLMMRDGLFFEMDDDVRSYESEGSLVISCN